MSFVNRIRFILEYPLDVEYEWFLIDVKNKIPLKYKYVNEAENGDNPKNCFEKEYQKQIIKKII